jgi:hypothetical protein
LDGGIRSESYAALKFEFVEKNSESNEITFGMDA